MSALPSPELVFNLIRSRRTTPLYRPDAVPQPLIREAIDAARWAPNHRLTEPWRFYLLGAETTERIISLNSRLVEESRGVAAAASKRERWSAIPGWLVLTSTIDEDPLRRREDYAACCCAAQNLLLFLWSAGVASKWTTGDVTRHPEFYEILGITADVEEVVAMIWYGYPAHMPRGVRGALDAIIHVRR